MLHVSCPVCNTVLNAPTSAHGKRVRCKECETVFRLPTEDIPEVFANAPTTQRATDQQISPTFETATNPAGTTPPPVRTVSYLPNSTTLSPEISVQPSFTPRGKQFRPVPLLLVIGAAALTVAGTWVFFSPRKQTSESETAATESRPNVSQIRTDASAEKEPTDAATKLVPSPVGPVPQSEIGLERLIAEAILKPTSTKYQLAGFKSFHWGDSSDELNAKVQAVESELTQSERQHVFLDSRDCLIGYSRSYSNDISTLAGMVRENFGTTSDSLESKGTDPFGTYAYVRTNAVFVFPKSVVVATIQRKVFAGRVPEDELLLYSFDRSYGVSELEAALKVTVSGMRHLKQCLEQLERNRDAIAELRHLKSTATRGPREPTQDEVTAFSETDVRWVAAGSEYAESSGTIFGAAVASENYLHVSGNDIYPGDIVLELWIDNAIGTKEHTVRLSRLGLFLQRAYVEAAMEFFPSDDGKYKRIEQQGRLSYEWKSRDGDKVLLYPVPGDGHILKVYRGRGPRL